jgi:hypothetical protein
MNIIANRPIVSILSTMHLDRQTFRLRPPDQSPGMKGANVQVAPIGRPIASTGRMFVVARPSRQYRQAASKWIVATEAAMARGSIGARVKTAPIS